LAAANGDFDKAIALEETIRKMDDKAFLHPLAIPLLAAVNSSARQKDMFDVCDGGYCFV
jgi:hypothetical protein